MSADDAVGEVLGGFQVEQLISSHGDVAVYRARDQPLDRSVLLRVAGESGAAALLEDARRIAALSHPSLVGVLGAGRSELVGYAAVPDVAALPLSEVRDLSPEQASRVAIDIAGAIEALAEAGLRATIDMRTVLVARSGDGVRGLLDPLRAASGAESCLATADPALSARELTDLLEQSLGGSDAQLPREIDAAGRRRRALVAGACLALVAAVAAAVVLHESSGGPSHPAASSPAARVVARIPLGIGGAEEAGRFTILGHTVWIATSAGRLLHVDAASNQVVGRPIAPAGQHPFLDVAASGGNLFTSDQAGWVLRIDPRTGRVTAMRHVPAALTAIRATNDVIWVTAIEGSKGVVLRFDAHTLRPVGTPVVAVPNAQYLAVQGARAWVVGSVDNAPQAVRVDVASRERMVASLGAQPTSAALAAGTLWITDRIGGTASALDARRMVFTREALEAPRSALAVLPAGADVWVAALDGLDTGQLRVTRFDARTGRRAGRPVVVGRSGVRAELTIGLGSLWALTATTLTRLAPADPRPLLQPAARTRRSPHALVPGPLSAGTWRTTRTVVPFTFSTRAFAWQSQLEEPDSVTLGATGPRTAQIQITIPGQVFTNDAGAARTVGDPASVLEVLRRNPRVRVGPVHHVSIGGRPALQFEVRADHPAQHPDVCGPTPCVLLFPMRDSTVGLSGEDVTRISLLRSAGRTVAIFEGGIGYDTAALAATGALVRTVRFS